MGKQDKKIHNMVHLHMLLLYGCRATLPLAFAIVEQFNQGLCVEEDGRFSSIMTTTTTQPNTTIRGPNKGYTISRSSKQITMAANEEVSTNSGMRCSGYGEFGHGKKDCPNSNPSDSKDGASENKRKVIEKSRGLAHKSRGSREVFQLSS